MNIQIDNLLALTQGRKLTIRQHADALIEFKWLVKYVEKLEQSTVTADRQVCDICNDELINPIHCNTCLTKFSNNT